MRIKTDINLVLDMTVREVERLDYAVEQRDTEAIGTDITKAASACEMWASIKNLRFTKEGEELKIRDLLDISDTVQQEFLQQHRVNYALFNVVQAFSDYLDDKKLLTKSVKMYWKKAEKSFTDYQQFHRNNMDRPSWNTFQDHMRLSFDTVQEHCEAVKTAIRDYIIQHRAEMVNSGQKDDIALLTDVSLCLMFIAGTRNTFEAFFMQRMEQYGVDFTSDFQYANISKVGVNFVRMCEQLGVRMEKDSDGDFKPVGVNVDKGVRIMWAWKELVDTYTDEDLIDETAVKAINFNPIIKEGYEARIKAESEMEMIDAVNGLSDKFNVKKLK